MTSVPPSDDDSPEAKASLAALASARDHILELVEERNLGALIILFSAPNQYLTVSRLEIEGGALENIGNGEYELAGEKPTTPEEALALIDKLNVTRLMMQAMGQVSHQNAKRMIVNLNSLAIAWDYARRMDPAYVPQSETLQ